PRQPPSSEESPGPTVAAGARIVAVALVIVNNLTGMLFPVRGYRRIADERSRDRRRPRLDAGASRSSGWPGQVAAEGSIPLSTIILVLASFLASSVEMV